MTRTRRLAAAYIALAAAVAVLFALNLFWGSVSLAPGAVLTALLGKGGDALAGNIILQLRLPRAVMAALLVWLLPFPLEQRLIAALVGPAHPSAGWPRYFAG